MDNSQSMGAPSMGAPINASLQFQPGGNPIAGIMGGPAGLAASYGQDYNSYLNANQQNYNNITGGYQTLLNNVGNILGAGGTPWGVAAPAAAAIADVYQQTAGGAFQNSINAGTGNTTAASAAQRGAGLSAQKAYAGLGSNLASTYAGYATNIGQSQLGFMNSVQIPPPNGQEYYGLYQNYGQTQQAAADRAQAMQVASLHTNLNGGNFVPGGGGGGSYAAPTPQMPRGGTFGAGGGGQASGGPGYLGFSGSPNLGNFTGMSGFGAPSNYVAAGPAVNWNDPSMGYGYGAGGGYNSGTVGDFGAGYGGGTGGYA